MMKSVSSSLLAHAISSTIDCRLGVRTIFVRCDAAVEIELIRESNFVCDTVRRLVTYVFTVREAKNR